MSTSQLRWPVSSVPSQGSFSLNGDRSKDQVLPLGQELLKVLYKYNHIILTSLCSVYFYHPHFTDEETEVRAVR